MSPATVSSVFIVSTSLYEAKERDDLPTHFSEIIDAMCLLLRDQMREKLGRELTDNEYTDLTQAAKTHPQLVDHWESKSEGDRAEFRAVIEKFTSAYLAKIAQMERNLVEIRKEKEVAIAQIEQAQQLIAEAERKRAEAERKRAEAERKRAEGERMIAEARRGMKVAITQEFYRVFAGNPELAEDEVDPVFDKYLTDRSITVVKTSSNTGHLQIHSMGPFIDYLKHSGNTKVKTLNFSSFEEHVSDVETLADFLKTFSPIKNLGIHSGITEAAKAALAETIAERASKGIPLKLKYYGV